MSGDQWYAVVLGQWYGIGALLCFAAIMVGLRSKCRKCPTYWEENRGAIVTTILILVAFWPLVLIGEVIMKLGDWAFKTKEDV